VKHDLKRQLNFGFVNLLRFRDVRLFAAPPILGPFLGQVQASVNQADSIRLTERAKNTHLAIVLFALAAVPLAPNAYRFLAFLLKGTLVNVKPCANFPAHPMIRILRHLIHHRAIVPGRMGEKILQHLIIAVGYRFGHALHIPFIRLHQTAQVLLRRCRHMMISRAKKIMKRFEEFPVVPAQIIKRWGIANPIF
jgi:hypothetical protein